MTKPVNRPYKRMGRPITVGIVRATHAGKKMAEAAKADKAEGRGAEPYKRPGDIAYQPFNNRDQVRLQWCGFSTGTRAARKYVGRGVEATVHSSGEFLVTVQCRTAHGATVREKVFKGTAPLVWQAIYMADVLAHDLLCDPPPYGLGAGVAETYSKTKKFPYRVGIDGRLWHRLDPEHPAFKRPKVIPEIPVESFPLFTTTVVAGVETYDDLNDDFKDDFDGSDPDRIDIGQL